MSPESAPRIPVRTTSGIAIANRTEPTFGWRPSLVALSLGAILALQAKPHLPTLAWLGPGFWVFVLAGLLVAPFILQWREGRFDPFTPTTFPVWAYLAPAFVGGSLLLICGLARHPMSAGLVPEPTDHYYALALVYLSLGWFGLLVGFYSPWGSWAGDLFRSRLPNPVWKGAEVRRPAVAILLVGVGFYLLAYRNGLVGYQRVASAGRFDALLIYTTWLAQLGVFLLWWSLFSRRGWTRSDRLIATLLALLGASYSIVSGSRAALFTYLLVLAAGFCFSGRAIAWRHVVSFCLLTAVALGFGTIWGTTYRQIKGNEEPLARTEREQDLESSMSAPVANERWMKTVRPPLAGDQAGSSPGAGPLEADSNRGRNDDPRRSTREVRADDSTSPTLQEQRDGASHRAPDRRRDPDTAKTTTRTAAAATAISATRLITETAKASAERSLAQSVLFAAKNLGERVEITSSVAVVVANYERLRPEEVNAGIADNIWRDTWTSIIPRALWPEKPAVSDARTYSQVYFRYGHSSFAITPVADLLRNYGPIGIPLGMALLGVALRFLFRVLVEGQLVQAPRAALFVAILMGVSYEGFYGAILPITLRIGLVTCVGLCAVHLAIAVQARWRLTTSTDR